MFLPNAARRLTGGVLSLLVRVRLVRRPEEAREKLEKQMEEYRRGADCVRRNPALVPALLGLTFCQLTALFSVPLVVYYAFGLTGQRGAGHHRHPGPGHPGGGLPAPCPGRWAPPRAALWQP